MQVVADEVQRASDATTAGELLRPALLLWVTAFVVQGAWTLLDVTLLAGPAWLSWEASCAVGDVLFAVVVAVFAWRDRAMCRVFVPPRRGMVELCLLVGIAGGLLLAMWERALPVGGASIIAAEHAAGWPLWLCLSTSAVMPAVFEELMFRGVILQRLRGVVAWRLAIAFQATLFSVVHLDGFALLPHFVFGCLAGFLRVAAGALWPSMLMHFVWNGWIVLVVYGAL